MRVIKCFRDKKKIREKKHSEEVAMKDLLRRQAKSCDYLGGMYECVSQMVQYVTPERGTKTMFTPGLEYIIQHLNVDVVESRDQVYERIDVPDQCHVIVTPTTTEGNVI